MNLSIKNRITTRYNLLNNEIPENQRTVSKFMIATTVKFDYGTCDFDGSKDNSFTFSYMLYININHDLRQQKKHFTPTAYMSLVTLLIYAVK